MERSKQRLLDALIGWRDAPVSIRVRLLEAFCSGIRLRSLLSNSVTLVILAGLIIAETRDPAHVVWLAAVVLGGLLPRAYARRLRTRDDVARTPERVALKFLAISAAYGLVWGVGPFLLLPQVSGAAVGILLTIMVFGTIMGPYASMPGILYVRLATTGLPTLVAVALHTTPQITFVCVVLGGWLVLRTDVWRGYHRTLRQQYELREALEQRQRELEQAGRAAERANRQLKHMAETDPLTGAANRRQFMRRLATLPGAGALVLFDIDHFKSVNDSFGHDVGDRVLIELVRLVQETLRDQDVLARLGGEEFAVLLHGVSIERAYAVAERIRERVASYFASRPATPGITISAGVAALPGEAAEADLKALLRAADAALYAAKGQGRNRTCRGVLPELSEQAAPAG